MICPVCNHTIPDGSNFCPACAADLTKIRRQQIQQAQQPHAKRGQDPMMQQQSGRYYPPDQQQQPSGRYYPPDHQQQQSGMYYPPDQQQQQSGRYYPPDQQQQQSGRYYPPDQPQQPSGRYYPPNQQGQHAPQKSGEGGIFEGITPRGKLFFAIGAAVLLVVLILLIVRLFGDNTGNKGEATPTIQPSATFEPYGYNAWLPTDAPELDPIEEIDLSVQPTTAPTPVPVFTVLKKGATGEEVVRLQERLKLLGFLPQDAVIDGQYGGATAEAVRKFQTSADLPVDGDAGPVTQTKLFSIIVDDSGASTGTEQQQVDDSPVNQPG